MNAKVVFIVELKAWIGMFFYCLLQINSNLICLLKCFRLAKIERDFKYTSSFEKKIRILTLLAG